MKIEVKTLKKTGSEQTKRTSNQNTKVVDLGYENFTVGVIHRASTRSVGSAEPQAPEGCSAGAAAGPAESRERQMATPPPGGTPRGIIHDFQTEGYYIVSGGGTMFTDGYIVNDKVSEVTLCDHG